MVSWPIQPGALTTSDSTDAHVSQFQKVTHLLKDILNVARCVWRSKKISASEASMGSLALQQLNERMGDPYTRQSILSCGIVPFLVPMLKLAALQQNVKFSVAPFQLSILTTLSYIFIFAAKESPNPLQNEAVRLLIHHQRLYDTALLCLFRSPYRDVKNLCASTLFFVLDSGYRKTPAPGTRPREPCGKTACYILFSSLFRLLEDDGAEHQESSVQDCCIAILGCIKLMVQKGALSVDIIRSSSAMNLLQAPAEYLPRFLLSNRHICNLLQLVQESVISTATAPSRSATRCNTFEGQESLMNSCPSNRSKPHGATLSFHGSVEEVDAVCKFLEDMKASIYDDALIDSAHLPMGNSTSCLAPSFTLRGMDGSERQRHIVRETCRVPADRSEYSEATVPLIRNRHLREKCLILNTSSSLHLANLAADSGQSHIDMHGMHELSDLTSPPTMMREAPQGRHLNPKRDSFFSDAVPVAPHPRDAPVNSIRETRQKTQPSAPEVMHGTSGWDTGDEDDDVLHTYQASPPSDPSVLPRCPGGLRTEWLPHRAASLTAALGSGHPPRPPSRRSGLCLKAAQALLSGTSFSRSQSRGDDIGCTQSHCRSHALTQANIHSRGATAVVGRDAGPASTDSCVSSSDDSGPSMVLSAAVSAFCMTQYRSDSPDADHHGSSAGCRRGSLSAANLQEPTDMSNELPSTSQVQAESFGLVSTTAASSNTDQGRLSEAIPNCQDPCTPRRRVVLPPSAAIPGCKSSEHVECSPEASKNMSKMHAHFDANPKPACDNKYSTSSIMQTHILDGNSLCTDTYISFLPKSASPILTGEAHNEPCPRRPRSMPNLSHALNPNAPSFEETLPTQAVGRSTSISSHSPLSATSPAACTSRQQEGPEAVLPGSGSHQSMCSSGTTHAYEQHWSFPWDETSRSSQGQAAPGSSIRVVETTDQGNAYHGQCNAAEHTAAALERYSELWQPPADDVADLMCASGWHADAWDACNAAPSTNPHVTALANESKTLQDIGSVDWFAAPPGMNQSSNAASAADTCDQPLRLDPVHPYTALPTHNFHSRWMWVSSQATLPYPSATVPLDMPEVGVPLTDSNGHETQRPYPAPDSPEEYCSQEFNSSDLMRDSTLRSILRESGVLDSGADDTEPIPSVQAHQRVTAVSPDNNLNSCSTLMSSCIADMTHPSAKQQMQSQVPPTACHPPAHLGHSVAPLDSILKCSSSELEQRMCRPQPSTENQRNSKSMPVARGAPKFTQEFPKLGENRASIAAAKVNNHDLKPIAPGRLISGLRGQSRDHRSTDDFGCENVSDSTSSTFVKSDRDSSNMTAQYKPSADAFMDFGCHAAEPLSQRPHSHERIPFMHQGNVEKSHAPPYGLCTPAEAENPGSFMCWGDRYPEWPAKHCFGPMHGTNGVLHEVGEPCASQDIQHLHPDSGIFSCPQGMRHINSLLQTDENNAARSNTDPPLLRTLHTTTGSAPPAMHAVGYPPFAAHPHTAMTSAHMWGMYPSVPPAAATPAAHVGTPMHMQGPMMLVPLASLQKSLEPN